MEALMHMWQLRRYNTLISLAGRTCNWFNHRKYNQLEVSGCSVFGSGPVFQPCHTLPGQPHPGTEHAQGNRAWQPLPNTGLLWSSLLAPLHWLSLARCVLQSETPPAQRCFLSLFPCLVSDLHYRLKAFPAELCFLPLFLSQVWQTNFIPLLSTPVSQRIQMTQHTHHVIIVNLTMQNIKSLYD